VKKGFMPDSALARMLSSLDLRVIDVGARGKPLLSLRPLMPFVHLYACEPDHDEAKRLEEALKADARWRGVTVFNDALAATPGEAQLLVTQKPGMSSLLEPDAAVVNRYCRADAFEVAGTSAIQTTTLDAAATAHGFTDAAFLKLDTQGTELEILCSGDQLVAGPVVAVYVETLFHPFYRNQSLFGDVDRHLRSRGFSLFDLARTHLRRTRTPDQKGYYSRRPIVWAHCLYLKEPESLEVQGDAWATGLKRLVAVAVAFEHFDFAVEALVFGRDRSLLDDAFVDELTASVEAHATLQTQKLLRGCATDDARNQVMACAARDHRGP
jgi:FkbM family methyltransferase